MKNYIYKAIILLITLSSCNDGYHEEIVTLIAINEQLDCEEENIFYRMLSCSEELDYIKDHRDSIVLFDFSTEVLKEENYYSSFFPSFSEKRFRVKVAGVFHSKKNKGQHYYHCIDASVFEVREVISFEDVTTEETFPISY